MKLCSLELPTCVCAKWRSVRSLLVFSTWLLHSNSLQTARTSICDVAFGSVCWAQDGLTSPLAAWAAISQDQLKGSGAPFTVMYFILSLGDCRQWCESKCSIQSPLPIPSFLLCLRASHYWQVGFLLTCCVILWVSYSPFSSWDTVGHALLSEVSWAWFMLLGTLLCQ